MCQRVELTNDKLSDNMAGPWQGLHRAQDGWQLLGDCARMWCWQYQWTVVLLPMLTNSWPEHIYNEQNITCNLTLEPVHFHSGVSTSSLSSHSPVRAAKANGEVIQSNLYTTILWPYSNLLDLAGSWQKVYKKTFQDCWSSIISRAGYCSRHSTSNTRALLAIYTAHHANVWLH